MTDPTGPEQQHPTLAELTTALAQAQSIQQVAGLLAKFPAVLPEAVAELMKLGAVRGLVRAPVQSGPHVAQQAMSRHNLMRRASYLILAGQRVSRAWTNGPRTTRAERMRQALRQEKVYLGQHLEAHKRRVRSGAAVAQEAARVARSDVSGVFEAPPGLLGWYAVLDDRTSRDCRLANGRNFDPKRVPRIGFPGSVHPACRCRPGPPHPTRLRVEDVRGDVVRTIFGRRAAKREIAASTPQWRVDPGWTATIQS